MNTRSNSSEIRGNHQRGSFEHVLKTLEAKSYAAVMHPDDISELGGIVNAEMPATVRSITGGTGKLVRRGVVMLCVCGRVPLPAVIPSPIPGPSCLCITHILLFT